jgi:hypothetical protein
VDDVSVESFQHKFTWSVPSNLANFSTPPKGKREIAIKMIKKKNFITRSTQRRFSFILPAFFFVQQKEKKETTLNLFLTFAQTSKG